MLSNPIRNSEDAAAKPPWFNTALAFTAMLPLAAAACVSLVAAPVMARPLIHAGIIMIAKYAMLRQRERRL